MFATSLRIEFWKNVINSKALLFFLINIVLQLIAVSNKSQKFQISIKLVVDNLSTLLNPYACSFSLIDYEKRKETSYPTMR